MRLDLLFAVDTVSRLRNIRHTAVFLLAIMILLPCTAAAELPVEVQLALQDALDELVDNPSRVLGVEFGGTIAVHHLDGPSDSNRFVGDFTRFVATELARTQPVEVDSPVRLSSRLESLYMDLTDLQDRDKRRAFYQSPQGSQLQWVVLLRHTIRATEIAISMTLEQVESGAASTRVERVIVKTDSVYEYLGEPVPRTLYVDAPKGARIYIAGHYVGIGGGQPIPVRLLPGRHNLKVDLHGYAKYGQSFYLGGQSDWDIKIDKRDNSGVSAKSFLLGAVLPGASVLKYGSPKTAGKSKRPSDEFATVAAGAFYVALGIWAVDHFRPKDPLTVETQDRNDKIETAELGIVLACYVANLVGSIWVGRDFARDNRELVVDPRTPRARDVGLSDLPGSVGLGLVYGPDGPSLALSYTWPF